MIVYKHPSFNHGYDGDGCFTWEVFIPTCRDVAKSTMLSYDGFVPIRRPHSRWSPLDAVLKKFGEYPIIKGLLK